MAFVDLSTPAAPVIDLTADSTLGSTVDYYATMAYANPLENPVEDYPDAIYMANASGRAGPKGTRSRLDAYGDTVAVADASRSLVFDFDNVRDALPFALWNSREVNVMRN